MTAATFISDERDLVAFIEYAPIAIAMFDNGMRYIAASMCWKTDYGLGTKPIIGMSHYEVFPEISERWKTFHKRALNGEVLREDFDRFDREDGSVQWLRWELQPWRHHDGSIGGIIIVTEDVTRYVRSEDSLKHLSKILKAIHSITSLITTEKEQKSILAKTCKILTSDYGYMAAWGFLKTETETINFVCENNLAANFDLMKSRVERGIFPHCFEKAANSIDCIVLPGGSSECLNCPFNNGIGNTTALVKTLKHEGKSYGMLAVRIYSEQSMNREEQFLFQEVADVTAFAIAFTGEEKARHIAEQETIKVSRKLESAIESSTDAIFISDTEGKFINFNSAFATFHKFGNKSECAKTLAEYPAFLEVYFPDGRLARLEEWAVPRALKGETGTNVEYALRRKDTGESWFGSYSFAPIRDESENIVGSIVSGRDITEAKHTVEKLRESESRFSTIFHASPLPILYGHSNNGILIDVNEAFVGVFGYEKTEAVGRRSDEFGLLAAKDREFLFKTFETQGKVENQEIQAYCKNGKMLETMVSFVPITLSGENCTLGILADISEQKRVQKELRQTVETKDLLLTELYHRTKNNMMSLISMMSIQASIHPEQDVKSFTDECSQRILALALVHEMLYKQHNLSRIDIKEYLIELVAEIISGYGKSPMVDFAINSEIPAVSLETANAMALIAVELLTNSLRHAFPDNRSGAVNITITGGEKSRLWFQYQDNGIGLPPQFRDEDFGGYGKKIVKALAIDQLGGTIEVKSEKNVGTVFIISFSDDKYCARV